MNFNVFVVLNIDLQLARPIAAVLDAAKTMDFSSQINAKIDAYRKQQNYLMYTYLKSISQQVKDPTFLCNEAEELKQLYDASKVFAERLLGWCMVNGILTPKAINLCLNVLRNYGYSRNDVINLSDSLPTSTPLPGNVPPVYSTKEKYLDVKIAKSASTWFEKIGCDDIYEFLSREDYGNTINYTANTDLSALKNRCKGIISHLDKMPGRDLEDDVAYRIAHFALDELFVDQNTKQLYDNYLAHVSNKELNEWVEAAASSRTSRTVPSRIRSDIILFKSLLSNANVKEIAADFDCYCAFAKILIKDDPVMCPKCNAENSSDSTKCSKCGASLVSFCPKCGKTYSGKLDKCPSCGFVFADIDRLKRLFDEAKTLIADHNLIGALSKIEEIEKIWSNYPEINSLRHTIEKDPSYSLVKKYLSDMREKRLYDARLCLKQLITKGSSGKHYDGLLADVNNRISNFEKRLPREDAPETPALIALLSELGKEITDSPQLEKLVNEVFAPKSPVSLNASALPYDSACKIRLTWAKSVSCGNVIYKLIRKEGSIPSAFHDGKVVYSGNSTEYTDIVSGFKEYYYKVFVVRNDVTSRTGTASSGVTAVPEVRNIRSVEYGDRVEISWEFPVRKNVSAEAWYCQSDTPVPFNSGEKYQKMEMTGADTACFKNRKANKSYCVFVRLIYTDPQNGSLQKSKGEVYIVKAKPSYGSSSPSKSTNTNNNNGGKNPPKRRKKGNLILLLLVLIAAIGVAFYCNVGNVRNIISGYLPSVSHKNPQMSNRSLDLNNSNSMVVRMSDGTVLIGGDEYHDDDPASPDGPVSKMTSDWNDVVSVSLCLYNSVALHSDGTVSYAGVIDEGSIRAIASWTDLVDVLSSEYFIAGLKSNGRVVIVRSDRKDTPILDDIAKATKWRHITKIAAASSFIVGIRDNGRVVAAGRSDEGQTNVSEWRDIVDIDCGFEHTVGLKADGTVIATGDNTYGQCDVQNWTDIAAVDCGKYHTLGLRADGTVVVTGVCQADRDCIEKWTNIVEVAGGNNVTVGVNSDGKLLIVGNESPEDIEKINEDFIGMLASPTGYAVQNPNIPEAAAVFNGHSYHIYTERMSWDEAKAKCEQLGGHLAVITSKEEQEFLESALIPDNWNMWLGGSKTSDENWKWVTDEEWDYTNWNEGEPNNSGGEDKLCTFPFGWNDLRNDSSEIEGYICEWDETRYLPLTGDDVPADLNHAISIPDDAVEYNGHYYKVYDNEYTWEDAAELCESMGGHLVSITSAEEQQQIESLISSGKKKLYWIGAYRETESWAWITGEEFSYSNWESGQPDGYKVGDKIERYGQIYREKPRGDSTYKWNDAFNDNTLDGDEYRCVENMGFICEWDIIRTNLSSIEPLDSGWMQQRTLWDSSDVEYEDGIVFDPGCDDHSRRIDFCEYALRGNYTDLSGYAFIPTEAGIDAAHNIDTDVKGCIRIYLDDALVWESGMMSKSSDAVPFSVSLVDVDILRIEAYIDRYYDVGRVAIGHTFFTEGIPAYQTPLI